MAFGLFLALGVVLSGWPMLQHFRRQHALEVRATELLSRPLEAEIAELLLRVRGVSIQAIAYHELLEKAEGHLWEFKSIRESSLILKDVGNEEGELGLKALKTAYPEFAGNLVQLHLALAQAERDWKALRNQASVGRLREARRGLTQIAVAARRQEQLLQRYIRIAGETGARVAQFKRLAPQVVGRVPDAVGRLPRQLRRLRDAIANLGHALNTFSGAGPSKRTKP